MKNLSSEQKKLILSFGYPKEDLNQIEKALKYTDFQQLPDDENITIEKAVEILGEKTFLSGMCRSAFHWSAVRESEKGEKVYFNSSRLFK